MSTLHFNPFNFHTHFDWPFPISEGQAHVLIPPLWKHSHFHVAISNQQTYFLYI